MTVTATTTPTYPVPDKPFKIVFGATTGNLVRLWLTACPTDSVWYPKLGAPNVSRILIGESSVGRNYMQTVDAPGSYSIKLQEITKGASVYGGSYDGDPDNYQTETVIGETSWVLRVGQKLTTKIGSGGDTASLNLWVWDATIRPTTEQYHGESSPSITQWTSDKAKYAALDTTVTTGVAAKLAALANVAVSTALGSFVGAYIDDLISKFNLHIEDASKHAHADTTNLVGSDWKIGSSASIQGEIATLGQIEMMMLRHMTNDAGDGTGPGSGNYHTTADKLVAPITDPAGDARTVYLKLADLCRVYTSHVGHGSTIHTAADTSHDLTAATAMLALYETFLSVLAVTNPTAPDGEQSGTAIMISTLGSEKA